MALARPLTHSQDMGLKRTNLSTHIPETSLTSLLGTFM